MNIIKFFYNNAFFKIGIIFLIIFILLTNYQVFNNSYKTDKRYKIFYNVNLFDIESINHCMDERLFNLNCLKRQTFISFRNYILKNNLKLSDRYTILEINDLKKTIIVSVNEKNNPKNIEDLFLIEEYNRYLEGHFQNIKKSLDNVLQIALKPGAPQDMQKSLLGWNLINIFYIVDLQKAIIDKPGIEVIDIKEIKFFRKHAYFNLLISLILSLSIFIIYNFNKKIKKQLLSIY